MLAQGALFPEIASGVEGTAETTRVLALLVPHPLVAETASVQVVKLAGQLTVIPLRFVGPTIVPHDAVHE